MIMLLDCSWRQDGDAFLNFRRTCVCVCACVRYQSVWQQEHTHSVLAPWLAVEGGLERPTPPLSSKTRLSFQCAVLCNARSFRPIDKMIVDAAYIFKCIGIRSLFTVQSHIHKSWPTNTRAQIKRDALCCPEKRVEKTHTHLVVRNGMFSSTIQHIEQLGMGRRREKGGTDGNL